MIIYETLVTIIYLHLPKYTPQHHVYMYVDDSLVQRSLFSFSKYYDFVRTYTHTHIHLNTSHNSLGGKSDWRQNYKWLYTFFHYFCVTVSTNTSSLEEVTTTLKIVFIFNKKKNHYKSKMDHHSLKKKTPKKWRNT